MTTESATLILQAAACIAWCIIAYCVFQIAQQMTHPPAQRLAPASAAAQHQAMTQRTAGSVDVVRIDVGPGMKRIIDHWQREGYQVKRINGLILMVKRIDE